MKSSRQIVLPLFIAVGLWGSANQARAQELPQLDEIQVKSSIDGTPQPVRLWTPKTATSQPTPVMVFLHSWSGDYRQNNSKWLAQAVRRGWIFVHPNFRGRNDHPEACGSRLARQDVIDALQHVLDEYQVDRERVYLAGTSGGGHMTMLMAAYFPDHFSAATAWVGISDLAAWYEFHSRGDNGKPGRYAQMVMASCGGAPGTSAAVDAAYRERSPLYHLHRAAECPLDLNAGVNDGHTGSVPIHHTLQAFNAIAGARKTRLIGESEIEQLSQQRQLMQPTAEDQRPDPTYGRDLLLRRHTGPTRVTIFDGGHEGLPEPACEWLAAQRRKIRVPSTAD